MIKGVVIIVVLTAFGHQVQSQYLLAADIKRQKIKKVKPGKELIVITKTDTLDFYDPVYNEERKEWEDSWTGYYWYLSRVNIRENSIVLWNNLDERLVTIPVEDVEKLIFKLENRGIGRKVLVVAGLGGIVWAAVSDNSNQSVAALSLTLVSAAYLAGTVGRTKYREYRLVGIEE